jgi:hypothetical protein
MYGTDKRMDLSDTSVNRQILKEAKLCKGPVVHINSTRSGILGFLGIGAETVSECHSPINAGLDDHSLADVLERMED